ncbi:small acid-soluble spore protein SspI [Paenibacillus thalictri]|uniref:Small, acid-soluble spore protein I n=2 Tax=Paenibacillus thalictri TaxID=2527873 RepID=A0A4Q9DN58_9BACL|nr:small acid-soluble spore protein SspI [Paenibacillus thalictri]TBL76294.1 small acid-soluble spore protein SspI [Paenibacillus thalictri]
MNINLRQAIVQRVQGKSDEELAEIIEDSVDGDERALPGLGVLFEVIWKNTQENLHAEMISTLKSHVN